MNTSTVTPPAGAIPTEAEIRAYAHELYIQSGWLPGRDLDNWLEAEAHLTVLAQHAARSTEPVVPPPIDAPPARATHAARPPRAKHRL